MKPQRVIILGSTGSIGRRALDVIRNHPGEFEVVGLSARGNTGLLREQVTEFRPRGVAIAGPSGHDDLDGVVGPLHVWCGPDANSDLVREMETDILLVATVGIVGLKPTLEALRPGTTVALANKEVLVSGGELVMGKARELGVPILPVDSEHNAIAQCLRGHANHEVRRLILTASGGPFSQSTREEMAAAQPEAALRHPTWTMGAKITIDSATLMNKGFEVLEAAHLFHLPLESVDVVIHPGSVVHSLVEFVDGSILAQLGPKDMYLPIQNCLLGLARRPTPIAPLDLLTCGNLEFRQPDLERFPCLALAYEAGRRGGIFPAVLNGANEIAVERFLNRDLGFLEIAQLAESVLNEVDQERTLDSDKELSLEKILDWDQWSRSRARSWSSAARVAL